MEKSWKITLSDGTQLKDLKLSGNNYISKTKITEDDFKGKLSKVIIENETDKISVELEHVELVQIVHYEDALEELENVLKHETEEDEKDKEVAKG